MGPQWPTINKRDLMKLKGFSTAEETVNQLKRQPMERGGGGWGKNLCRIHLTEKWCLDYVKNSKKLNIKKTQYPI